MTLAYLTNQYPKVSHTFIRREIRALETMGHRVLRYSIRSTPDDLSDPEDLREKGATKVVLQRPPAELAAATARVLSRHPERWARAAKLALTLGIGSDRGAAVHAAYLAEACWLREELAKQRVTHQHVHFGTNPATVAMLCHELGGPPWSFTVHGPEEFDRAPVIGLREKIRAASFVVAVSSYGRSQLYRLSDSSQWGKIHVVGCGVDDEFLDTVPTPVPDEPRLVCIGRLSEQKGQLLLVEAAAELARKGERFEIVLVGDGELRPEIERRVREHGLGGNVRITGWLSGRDVRREIERSRALVLPSFAEGLPVAIMEALALGRPVVSTFIAGIPELVEPGHCGFLVPAGSVDALTAALSDVLAARSEDLGAMGRAGRLRVQARHDARRNAALLSELFQGNRQSGALVPRVNVPPQARGVA